MLVFISIFLKINILKNRVKIDMENEKKKLYISYSWEEDGIEEWIEKFICNIGSDIKIVYDKDRLYKKGADIDRFVHDNMTSADFIAIIVTPSYIKKANKLYTEGTPRSWVEVENDYILQRFHNRKETLFPIIAVNNENDIKLPNTIPTISYYDMSSPNKYIFELERLKKIICSNSKDFKIKKTSSLLKEELNKENGVVLKVFCKGELPQLNAILCVGQNEIYLNHKEMINIFLLKYSNNSCYEHYTDSIATDIFKVNISKTEFDIIQKIINKNLYKYLKEIRYYEKKYETSQYPLSENGNYYKLFCVKKDLWNKLIKVANEHDWDKGNSKWHIFQYNLNMIHVFSPVISYNPKYNSGEHAIFRAYNNENIGDDEVDICINIDDLVGYDNNGQNISIQDKWGVNTAAVWLIKTFIPFALNNRVINFNSGLVKSYMLSNIDVFSKLQEFCAEYRCKVTKDEMEVLVQTLVYCLQKKYPVNEYNYIRSKLVIESLDLHQNEQKIANDIIDYLKSKRFLTRINDNNNSSLADNVLRCIRVFTDTYSTSKLSEIDYKLIKKMNKSLINKMRIINLLDKYCIDLE